MQIGHWDSVIEIGARRVSLFFAGLLLIAGCSGSTLPESTAYPNRPIKLIVPFGAGGGTDVFARRMEQAIRENHLLPQPVAIINVGGAGATIGSRRVKNARPDGYTVLILHDAIITAKLSGTVNYGPEAFEAIAGTGEQGMVIAVSEDSPYKSLNDLLEDAKQRPDEVAFGANLGALTHYAGLLLEKTYAGAKFRYVQIGGGAERFSQLAGGHIHVTGFSTEEFFRYRPKGLRGLCIFGEKRQPALPDVPTAKEQDIDIALSNTFYWWVPKGTPKERRDVLAIALRKAMQTPEVARYLEEIQCEPLFVRDEAIQKRIDASTALFSQVQTTPPEDVPNYTLIILSAIAVLCIARGIQWALERKRRDGLESHPAAEGVRPRTGTALIVSSLTLIYFTLLAQEWVPFSWATAAFVFAAGGLMIERNRRQFAVLAMVAIVMGFGLHALLVRVFDVQLV